MPCAGSDNRAATALQTPFAAPLSRTPVSMRHRPALRGSLFGLAFAATVLAACGGDGKPANAPAAPREVRVVAAERALLPDVVAVSGTLAAEEEVVLGMKVAGRLQELLVDLGSRGAKGQALARLAPTDFALRVKQAEAALAQAARAGLACATRPPDDGSRPGMAPHAPATPRIGSIPEKTSVVRQAAALRAEARARRDRARALFDQGLLPRADLDAAEAAYQVADSQYQDARDEVRQPPGRSRAAPLRARRSRASSSPTRCSLAPFDGAVRERQASPGEYLAAGQPVVTLRAHASAAARARRCPSAPRPRCARARRCACTSTATRATHGGTVARLSPAIDESNRTLMIEAEVPNADGALRPGSFARREIVTAADQPVLLVPQVGDRHLRRHREGARRSRTARPWEERVTTGRRRPRVEIVDGVAAGDAVVAEPGNLRRRPGR